MSVDLLIRGGRVVDGTGMPGFTADVAITDGRVVTVGKVDGPATRVIDADGLVVAPGFIDVHTHYDAQLDWDPTASPASWHGVTTVITGNCGFTLCPASPSDTPWLAQMLSRVEGMAPETLAAGLAWDGGSFGDFWRRLDGRLGVNAGSYVGHSAIRRMVMGDAASERRATEAEIRTMQDAVRAAMREGALGFSTSQLDIHVAHDGREVPSNHAAPEEIIALSAVLAEFGRGALEIIPRSFVEGMNAADRRLVLDMYRASGRPIEIHTLNILPSNPDGWRHSLEFCRDAWRQGARIHPMFATNKLGAHLSLDSTFLFDEIPIFRETLTLPSPERERRLRDPNVRERMREELYNPGEGRAFVFVWDVVRVEGVRDPAHAAWVGKTIPELAEAMGKDPLDCFLDCALAEDLTTQFELTAPESDYFRQCTAEQLRDGFVMAGSSDGGAHVLSFVGADYTTRLLTEWSDVLPLEAAVHRLTMAPAAVHGLADRGVLRAGAWADVVCFDPTRLRAGATRFIRDLPGGSGRYVVDAEGYVALVVNGRVLLEGGADTGARSGHVLRG